MDRASRKAIRDARLVITDFDGTLVRLTTDWDGVREILCRELGSGFRDNIDGDLRKLRRVSEEAFLVCCRMIAEEEIAGFHGKQVNLELLQVLKRSKRVAVFSSNTHEAIATILKDKIFGLNPLIVGKEDVTRGKPDPEGLLLCLGDVEKKDAVYIGDSVVDVEAGENAGIRTIKIGTW